MNNLLKRVKRLNEELDEVLSEDVGIEIFETVRYNESEDDEEIWLPPDEYARVMSALETWLKSNPQFRKRKYLNKGIQTTEEKAYAYTFKKVGGIKEYIIIYRMEIQ